MGDRNIGESNTQERYKKCRKKREMVKLSFEPFYCWRIIDELINKIMQPKALSLEPLMIAGLFFLVFVFIPGACILSWKLGRKMRLALIPPILLILVWCCFSFGEAVGR